MLVGKLFDGYMPVTWNGAKVCFFFRTEKFHAYLESVTQ